MDQIQTIMTPTVSLEDKPLAMAYVPMQRYEDIYEPEVGFDRGTMFKQLDKPFYGKVELPNG